jgi:predicted nuclease of predicted toxin-antitoxin system
LHVEDLGLAGAADLAVWQAAVEHRFLLVTKDEDFHRLSVLHGAPPKVVWLRLGNCTTQDIIDLLAIMSKTSDDSPRKRRWRFWNWARTERTDAQVVVPG